MPAGDANCNRLAAHAAQTGMSPTVPMEHGWLRQASMVRLNFGMQRRVKRALTLSHEIFADGLTTLAFSPDGKRVATGA